MKKFDKQKTLQKRSRTGKEAREEALKEMQRKAKEQKQ